jgi:hypothetical protein
VVSTQSTTRYPYMVFFFFFFFLKDSVEIQLLYSLTASQLQDGERAKTHRPGIGKVSKAEVKERSGVTHSNAGGAIGMQ